MVIQRNGRARTIKASEADVAPEVSELLFEAEDVAELIAEVTGEDVAVEADPESDAVVFEVAGEEFVVEPEGDEEILEARRVPTGRGKVAASKRRTAPPARKLPSRAPVKSGRVVKSTRK